MSKQEEKDQETFAQIWNETFSELKDIHGVAVDFRTLYDWEEYDCLRRATTNDDQSIQGFTLSRWQLAYAIKSVDNQIFEGHPEAKYSEIIKWPAIIVRLCIKALSEVYEHEAELVTTLGESSGADQLIPGDNDYVPTGLSLNTQVSETGQPTLADFDAAI